METYVYRSEAGNGQATFVATCPLHRRDICIHPSRTKAEKVAVFHDVIFHREQS